MVPESLRLPMALRETTRLFDHGMLNVVILHSSLSPFRLLISILLAMWFLQLSTVLACLAISVAQQPMSVDNGDPSIAYAPIGAWEQVERNKLSHPQLYNSSLSVSEIPGATATWSFRGTLVAPSLVAA